MHSVSYDEGTRLYRDATKDILLGGFVQEGIVLLSTRVIQDGVALQNGASHGFSLTFQSTWTPETSCIRRCYSTVLMQQPTCMTRPGYQASSHQRHLMPVTRRGDAGSRSAASRRVSVLGWNQTLAGSPVNQTFKLFLPWQQMRVTLGGPDGWVCGWIGVGGVQVWAGIIKDDFFVLKMTLNQIHILLPVFKRHFFQAVVQDLASFKTMLHLMHQSTPLHGKGHKDERIMTRPSSPDLNPVENLWALLKREIYIEGKNSTPLWTLSNLNLFDWPRALKLFSNKNNPQKYNLSHQNVYLPK